MIRFTLSAMLFASAVAGAQTVTLGTTTSSQNGSTTTITLPVTVAVPSASTAAAAALSSLRVETPLAVNQPVGSSFKTIALSNVVTDTASGWNASANTYTIPTTGTYLIISHFRLYDGISANIGYGQGVNTSNVDNANFLWSTTYGLRNSSTNVRIMQLSAGQTVDLFAYADAQVSLDTASLVIQQLQ